MDLAPLSLVLAVSTAWATIFLGFLPPHLLRLHSREVLKAAAAWILVALTAPRTVFHWYLIFAVICLVSWLRFWRDRALSGKVWLSVASGLGISLGIIFLIQAASAICPEIFSPAGYVRLASIYLGGAVAGFAYAGCVVTGNLESRLFAAGFAKGLIALTIAWAIVLGVELGSAPPFHLPESLLATPSETLLAPVPVLLILALLAGHAVRRATSFEARTLFVVAGIIAFATHFLVRLLGV